MWNVRAQLTAREYMKPPHCKLLGKCVAAEKALRGWAADQVNRKGESSSGRDARISRKRTPVGYADG